MTRKTIPNRYHGQSWTITVTKSGFYFLDTSVTDGGDGSKNNPWNNWNDFYLDRLDSTYKDAFLYFRAGRYTYPANKTYGQHAESNRLQLRGGHPHIFIGYPNETVEFDGENSTNKIHLHLSGSNFYFDNITFINHFSYGIEVNSGDNLTVRRSTFKNFITGNIGDNQGAISIKNDALHSDGTAKFSPPVENTAKNLKRYYVVQDTHFTNLGGSVIGIENYGNKYSLYEDNQFENCGYSCINLKSTLERVTIRNNTFTKIKSNAYVISITAQFYVTDTEILHNYMDSGIFQVGAFAGGHGPNTIHIYRNTVSTLFNFRNIESDDGPIFVENNVTVNSTPSDHIRDEISEHWSITANKSVLTDNLSGVIGDNIISVDGNLTVDYSTYIGSRGHVIPKMTPNPPSNLTVR